MFLQQPFNGALEVTKKNGAASILTISHPTLKRLDIADIADFKSCSSKKKNLSHLIDLVVVS